MDRDHHASEAERQLNDLIYYELLDHKTIDQFAKKVSEAIEEMFDDGQKKHEVPHRGPANSRYVLSASKKIHKAGNPGRPIVSANGHPT